ncbi:MAG: hypothetical protein J6A57_02160 [Ruminococcus sp.]|nr:hypothetical protein [Ruminococcus sp.]
MKTKLKTITAAIWLLLSSAMAYYCMIFGIFAVSETERWISSKDFYINNVVDSVIEVMLIVSYIFTYLSAMIYLCKQMYKIKKWMVCIPILASGSVIVLSIALFWNTYELF